MKALLSIFVLMLGLACYGQSSVSALASQVSSHSAELDLNAGGKATSRIGNGSGYYHMLIQIDLGALVPALPCTLSLLQMVANVGSINYDYAADSFKTRVSTVQGTWDNGSGSEDPIDGAVCWHERAYSTTAPVYWIAGNSTSTLASVSQGQGGSHVNSTMIYLNKSTTGLASYVVLDSLLVADLMSGFGGLLIDRAVGQTGEMKFSCDNVTLSWDPNGSPVAVNGAARIRSFSLQASNVPNPFRPTTEIRYTGTGKTPVIQIYNLNGALVRTLAGSNGSALWNGTNNNGQAVSAGAYVYRISDGQNQILRRMQLLR